MRTRDAVAVKREPEEDWGKSRRSRGWIKMRRTHDELRRRRPRREDHPGRARYRKRRRGQLLLAMASQNAPANAKTLHYVQCGQQSGRIGAPDEGGAGSSFRIGALYEGGLGNSLNFWPDMVVDRLT